METLIVQRHIYFTFLAWTGSMFAGHDPVQDINVIMKSVRWHARELATLSNVEV